MQIYLEDCAFYGFNQQKAFRARYMVRNLEASRKHQKHDESNVEHKGNALTKG